MIAIIEYLIFNVVTAQLAEFKKVTLAKVICDTIPDIKEIQKDVFRIENATT